MNIPTKNNGSLPSKRNRIRDFFSNDLFDWTDTNSLKLENNSPFANVLETEDDFQIEVAAPGLKKEDFTIEWVNNALHITVDIPKKLGQEYNYSRKEFNYHSFCRSFLLPENVDDSSIDAIYLDGILKITIGKRKMKSPKAGRNISIK